MSLKQAIDELRLAKDCEDNYLFYLIFFIPLLPLYLMVDVNKTQNIWRMVIPCLITAAIWTFVLYTCYNGLMELVV